MDCTNNDLLKSRHDSDGVRSYHGAILRRAFLSWHGGIKLLSRDGCLFDALVSATPTLPDDGLFVYSSAGCVVDWVAFGRLAPRSSLVGDSLLALALFCRGYSRHSSRNSHDLLVNGSAGSGGLAF
jgi:hypothetical protein